MCAIFGVLDYQGKLTPIQRKTLFQELANAAQIRGTDASGLACVTHGAIHIQKAPRPASKMRWKIPLDAKYLMGHTRMTTQGAASKNFNNHPFLGKAGKLSFALAHNGVLYNDSELRHTRHLPSTKIETDSYVAVQLLERFKNLSVDSIRQMTEALDGSFTITILSADNTLYLIRGNNPLTIRLFPKLGCYLYASTNEILDLALAGLGLSELRQTEIPVSQGGIIAVDSKGRYTRSHFNDTKLRSQQHFFNWDWHKPVHEPEYDDYLETVLEYGRRHGVTDQELHLLINAGYDAFDLEQLIFDDQFRASCVQEIMADFGVY